MEDNEQKIKSGDIVVKFNRDACYEQLAIVLSVDDSGKTTYVVPEFRNGITSGIYEEDDFYARAVNPESLSSLRGEAKVIAAILNSSLRLKKKAFERMDKFYNTTENELFDWGSEHEQH